MPPSRFSQSTTGGNKLIAIPEPIGTLTATDLNAARAAKRSRHRRRGATCVSACGARRPDTRRTDSWCPPLPPAACSARATAPSPSSVARDSVKDSQLSYAGLRDPAGNTLGNQGQIWGGVVANQGNVQFSARRRDVRLLRGRRRPVPDRLPRARTTRASTATAAPTGVSCSRRSTAT